MSTLPKIASLAFALCAISTPTFGQQMCAPREDYSKFLGDTHGEYLAGIGLINETTILEFYLNEESGTFTVVLSSPGADGKIQSCPKVGGKDYMPFIPKPKGDPA